MKARRVAVDRVLRAVVGGELDPGADLRQVALVEDQRARQDDRGAGDVGVAGARQSTARSFGFLARRVAAEEAQEELRLEAELLAALRPGTAPRRAPRANAAGSSGLAPPPSSEPAKANCEQLVGLSEKFLRSSLTATERMSSRAPP